MQGRFIVIEGCDFTGKTTQAQLLSQYLNERGIKYITTREPGGVAISEKIRELIMKDGKGMHTVTELLLFLSARSEHFFTKILPALENNIWVVCDRFMPSTMVYQSILGNVDQEMIRTIHRLLFGVKVVPDLTLILDMSPESIIERIAAHKERELNAYDNTDLQYITALRNGYLEYAKNNINCSVVNAERSHNAVLNDIKYLLDI